MNQQTQERIQIISQFKSQYEAINRFQVKRIKNLKIWGLLNYGLAILLLGFVLLLSISELLHFKNYQWNWDQAGLLVLMSMSLSIRAHFGYIEWLLLKHLKDLKNQEFIIKNDQNSALKDRLNELNYRRFKPYWIILPSLLIVLAVILKGLELNPYWDLFPLPVLIICILLLWNLNNQVYLVSKVIDNVKPNVLFI